MMTPRLLLLVSTLLVLVCDSNVVVAQARTERTTSGREPQGRERARRGRPRAIVSPEVGRDGAVTFRLRAPGAETVVVNGQWPDGRVSMTRAEDGVWEATVASLPPGVWEYSFQVDGLGMVDPGNPAIKPMREPRTSILHIPGEPPLAHDFQEVPHGVVHEHSYRSRALGRLRHFRVYTPPGYARDASARFPTLYLQHGSGDNHATWTVHGKAHWILDNLVAAGRARPMLIVMIDGHPAPRGERGRGSRGRNTELFERELLEDVLPMVEANYRVRTEADARALAGLSMGGGQALTVGLRHTPTFAWVAGFSSSVPSEEAVASALADAETTNARLELLWIACGKEDFLRGRNESFVALLGERGVKHEWALTEGNHSWPVWRRYLAELAPRLFR